LYLGGTKFPPFLRGGPRTPKRGVAPWWGAVGGSFWVRFRWRPFGGHARGRTKFRDGLAGQGCKPNFRGGDPGERGGALRNRFLLQYFCRVPPGGPGGNSKGSLRGGRATGGIAQPPADVAQPDQFSFFLLPATAIVGGKVNARLSNRSLWEGISFKPFDVPKSGPCCCDMPKTRWYFGTGLFGFVGPQGLVNPLNGLAPLCFCPNKRGGKGFTLGLPFQPPNPAGRGRPSWFLCGFSMFFGQKAGLGGGSFSVRYWGNVLVGVGAFHWGGVGRFIFRVLFFPIPAR